jgi:alkylation response protein AidB-like acyl-CoA dehydrogenase
VTSQPADPAGVASPQELADLRATVRRFLAEQAGPVEVRRVMLTPEGFDRVLWGRMAVELGLQALTIPEKYGGAGFSLVEVGAVLQEMGAALLCSPYMSSAVLAAHALILSGDDEAMTRYLPGIAAGDTIATCALAELWDPAALTINASKSASGWRLDGSQAFVIDGMAADLVLVAARTDVGITLFAVDPLDPGVDRMDLSTVDLTRRMARMQFSSATAVPVGERGGGARLMAQLQDIASVALAAEQVGTAQRALDASVAYATIRRQFGQPIGAFQAIKHKCADMLISVESARACVNLAASAAARGDADLPVLASMAKACASDACLHVTGENIQIHGAIGFTWEHEAHLLFKRAATGQLLFGDPTAHRDRVVRELGIQAAS